MTRTTIVYYREEDGAVPILDWLDAAPRKATAECLAFLARLEAEGHELRRPVADDLRDGIYELRPSLRGVHCSSRTTDMWLAMRRRRPQTSRLFDTEVASLVYNLRQKAGLTQRALAKKVGTTASVICRLEDADHEATH